MRYTMTVTINWEEIWERNINDIASRTTVDYWESRAEDYSDMVLNSEFHHGEQIRKFCFREALADTGSQVIDIGSGPGALTIPFARNVQSVTAVEPAAQMIQRLTENAKGQNLKNIYPLQKIWQEVDTKQFERTFDLVLCCHSLWHFPDIMTQLQRMDAVSRGYCCIAGGFGTSEDSACLYKTLGIREMEFDQFHCLFNLLNSKGMRPNVTVLPYETHRSEQSAITSMEQVVQKYRPLVSRDADIIRDNVKSRLKNGLVSTKGLMGLLWWRAV